MVLDNHALRIAGIERESIVDGPGYRYTIYTQGCPHNCPGCHNPETHANNGGSCVNIQHLYEEFCATPQLRGITFSGGEPFLQARPLAELAEKIRNHHADKTVVTYTGYTYEYLLAHANKENGWKALLQQTDYLIDGPYLQEEASIELAYKGSKNQRIIDVAQSQSAGRAVVTTL